MFNFQKILDFLIPRRCAGCGKSNEAFCAVCRASSSQNSSGCLLCGFRNDTGEFCKDCRRKSDFLMEDGLPSTLKSVFWAGRYDEALKKAVWELKYGKRRELARPLAEMLAEKFAMFCENSRQASILEDLAQRDGASRAIRQQADMRVLQNAALVGNFITIPIPLHFKRQYERGFNQAELLAKEFSKITGIAMRNDILKKIKETPAQVEVQNKELRLKNLEGVFEVNLNASPNPLLIKEGAKGVVPTIILIDDVSTTGATLMHAAEALKNAGAKNITGLVVAHG